jgi:hypothetical protein
MAAQSPNDSNNTKISASPLLSEEAASALHFRWFLQHFRNRKGKRAPSRCSVAPHLLFANRPEEPSASLAGKWIPDPPTAAFVVLSVPREATRDAHGHTLCAICLAADGG